MAIDKPILVTGGTGTLGRHLVRLLGEAGQPVRVLSRRARPDGTPEDVEWAVGDMSSGDGLREAVRGVGVIVNCASDTTRMGRADAAGVRHLLDAVRESGAESDGDGGHEPPHLVHVSIVGIDRVPFIYYKAKLEVERIIESAGLPWTILRATQFHDLVARAAQALAHSPVLPVPPGVRVQPVDAAEVAARLVTLTQRAPAGRAEDFGGPQIRDLAELFRAYLRATGKRRTLLPTPLPGLSVRRMRAGALLAPQGADGTITFEDYLAASAASAPQGSEEP
jgi:uncharacterized protein YbjT (DUF2867 family)